MKNVTLAFEHRVAEAEVTLGKLVRRCFCNATWAGCGTLPNLPFFSFYPLTVRAESGTIIRAISYRFLYIAAPRDHDFSIISIFKPFTSFIIFL
jgi:hypothetical protein